MHTIGLMIVPGAGYQDIEIASGTNLGQLVADKNLHGRTINVDGTVVTPEDYATTVLDGAGEVWATGGAKGA